MDIWRVRGGRRLEGSVFVQGSKNASLPIIAASIVCPTRTELMNVPELNDVDAALRILRHLGCRAEQQGGDVSIDARTIDRSEIPRRLMEEMRSSVMFMGALLARCGEARLSLPGGCQLGKRPIDIHLFGLRALGAHIEEDGGEISCRAEKLRGADITLPFPSVGATENIMLAACAAEGKTVIRNAAREPEIAALQDCLCRMGARVYGAGTDTVTVEDTEPAAQVGLRITPDRIVSATLACACAAAGGDVELCGVRPEEFLSVTDFLKEAGCVIISGDRSVRILSHGRLRAVREVVTAPYPGFPTDAQPVLMAALLKARGVTRMTENMFENRYRQAAELRKLGADITVSGRTAEIRGVERLHGAALEATDLRGGAAMLLAGLSAEGETVVADEGHIRRGYEKLDRRLRSLGADITLDNGEGNT